MIFSDAPENAARAGLRLHLMNHARAFQFFSHFSGLNGILSNGGYIQPHSSRKAGTYFRYSTKRRELHQVMFGRLGQKRRSAHSQRCPSDGIHMDSSSSLMNGPKRNSHPLFGAVMAKFLLPIHILSRRLSLSIFLRLIQKGWKTVG